jgi:hypothetical protein
LTVSHILPRKLECPSLPYPTKNGCSAEIRPSGSIRLSDFSSNGVVGVKIVAIMQDYEVINAYSKVFREKLDSLNDLTFLFSAFQALYRLFGADNARFHVLHASAALSEKGNAIVFGDDGSNSKGKTICSLILATTSHKYIADEYVLYEDESGRIFGNGNIPINLKENVSAYLRESLSLDLGSERVAFAVDHFGIVEVAEPSFIVIPYLGSATTSIAIPEPDEAAKIFTATVYGHNVKLKHPETDLVSSIREMKGATSRRSRVKDFLKNYPRIVPPVPLVKVTLERPEDILKVVPAIEDYYDKQNPQARCHAVADTISV